jgi:hypothetical protein
MCHQAAFRTVNLSIFSSIVSIRVAMSVIRSSMRWNIDCKATE